MASKRYLIYVLPRRFPRVLLTASSLQVVLETEYDNSAALSLYESLGFIREKRLFRFYLNGKDAFRLVLVVPPPEVDDEDDGKTIKRGLPIRFLAPARTIAIPALPYDSDDEVSSR